MTLRHDFLRVFPLSVSAYALAFILLLLATTASLRWLASEKMESLHQSIERQDRSSAQAEIRDALGVALGDAARAAHQLTNWDESRQLLAKPAAYAPWRDARALTAGVLPAYVNGLELYAPDGRSLAREVLPGMPTRVTPRLTGAYVLTENGQPELFYVEPILPAPGDHRPLGYGAIRFNLLQYLKSQIKYRIGDPDSFTWHFDEKTPLNPKLAVPYIGFSLLPHPETADLQNVINTILFQMIGAIALVAVLFYLLLMSLLGKPLRRLSQHIDALRDGGNDLLLAELGGISPVAELEKIRGSLNQYQSELDAVHMRLDQKNHELWTLAHYDPLTQVFNRRAFDEDWAHVFSIAAGRHIDVSFILFDCDHFKTVNDTYGHPVGDLVIQRLAENLRRALTVEKRLYRLGGDEFAAILLDSDPGYAMRIAESCLAHCDTRDFAALGIKEPLRISIGLAHADGRDMTALAELPKQADIAMYFAKRPGQHQIAVYSPDMKKEAETLLSSSIVTTVYDSIASGRGIEMHYQPVVRLPEQQAAYYEALVRIRSGDTLITAASILPIIHTHRLELEFDRAVIAEVHNDLLHGKLPRGTGVSVNLCGPTVVHAQLPDWLDCLRPFLTDYKIVLEVTETTLITQLQEASDNLGRLRQAGFVIALDDFGSGYSSLKYLASMPIDMVKFDISITRSLGVDDRQSMIAAGLAELIMKAGYQAVAEGVESEEALERVLRLGFPYAQSFLFGEPMADCRETTQSPLHRFRKALKRSASE